MSRTTENILIISGLGSKTPGVVAFDLYRGFRTRGYNTKLMVQFENAQRQPDIVSIHDRLYWKYWRRLYLRLKRVITKTPIAVPFNMAFTSLNMRYAPQSFGEAAGWYSTDSLLRRIPFKPDVIIFLFMDCFINMKNVYEISVRTKAKIFFYPMDMALMTGGCHYAWDCTGYSGNCGRCPAIYSEDPRDFSFRNHKFKQGFLSRMDCSVFAGTEQILGQLRQSSLFGNSRIVKCLLPIDFEVFKPGNKEYAKRFFGIEQVRKVIFFGATNTHDPRKGLDYLIEALDQLYVRLDPKVRDQVVVMIAGNGSGELLGRIKFRCQEVGRLDMDTTLPLAFQAADVFVSPSVQDSGPMMVNQSIMSGTPVVAFETGVALDLVISGKTGYLARPCDPGDFAHRLEEVLCLSSEDYQQMCENCRSRGMSDCRISDAVERIVSCFGGE